ncbi:MAG: dihydroorotate dehydrogenase electron transfer subunit [Nanoarchaeota archaeon]|nr:dihydroorotate dehydrogenase electron transfer subunit [Nanoarchaeota archaeon]
MRLGKKEVKGLFATVSGIGTTTADIIYLWAKRIPQLGIITTKSIGKEPKEGNVEPIICQVGKRSFRNAVGLANPGCEAFAEELKEIYPLPNGKFLLTSIFGKTAEELSCVARVLAPYSDGLELNFSCPHAEKGYGATIGSSKELTYKFTKAVKDVVSIPVVVKLTPNVDNIAEIAKAAEDAGADAISAINTCDPKEFVDSYTKKPVLTNVVGGLSGEEIRKVGLRCVKEISDAVSIPVIGLGGVVNAKDVKDYLDAGASVVGIGSALAGMSTEKVVEYFKLLEKDLSDGTNDAEKLTLDRIVMGYEPFKIKKIKKVADDLKIFYFDKDTDAKPGQFVFTWVPGHHEKPFSIAYNAPLVLAVRKFGHHTSRLFELKKGDTVMIRGPYGNGLAFKDDAEVFLVGGGTGAAPLYFLARQLKNPVIFIGGKNKGQLLFEKELKKLGRLVIATDDGSKGFHGFVTDALKGYLEKNDVKGAYFFNCGPEVMMKKAFEVEKSYTSLDKIYSSVERYCACGVGLCGKCSFDGKRLCVDGPVFDGACLANSKEFGVFKRDKSGKKVSF